MPIELNDFHFIRPYLLWLMLPALLIIFQLRHHAKKQSAWQNIISPHLLAFLFKAGSNNKSGKNQSLSTFFLTSLIALLIIIAISGPSFRQKPVPVFQTEHAQVILLDLSLSMNATDIQPSRLERAKFKLMDLLTKTKEGTVALVVYAGDAFIISPLTSDANTINNMIPTLSTGIMPVLGSRPDIAIDKAIELLKNAKVSQGEIIWLTDGVESEFINPISQSILDTQYQLSILAVGTEQGAPIPLPDGNGFLKDSSGSIVVPKLDLQNLTEITQKTKAGFVQLTADNSDINYLQQHQQWQAEANKAENKNEQMISRWIDDGYWIIWLALLLFLLKLIKQPASQVMSLLLPLLLITGGSFSPPASALEWKDLWSTKEQQAKEAYNKGEFDRASNLFEEKEWQATSQYKSGKFDEAAKNFDPEASTTSLYNHATSLAKANKLQESIDAYDQLLKKEPDNEDAKFNKKIVEELKKQQEQQQQDQQNKDQQSDQDKKDQDSQDSESDSQDKKEGEPDSEQQEQDKQKEEQQKDQEGEEKQQSEEEKEAEQKQAEMTKDEREKAEKDQALEHWLEKIPDDPGGLLRRKMYREYQLRGREQKEKKLW